MKYEDRFVNYSDVDTRRVIILVNKIHLFSKYTYFISKSVNCNFLDHKNCLKFTARKQDQMCFYNTKYRAGKKKENKKKIMTACAITRDKNRSKSASRRSEIMNVSAIQLK